MQILGIIDTLESVICDSPKIPFTGKTLINESEVLSLLDKVRLVCQKDSVAPVRPPEPQIRPIDPGELIKTDSNLSENPEVRAIEIIQQAYQLAKEIKDGADKYADEVLADLEVTSMRVTRVVKNGRQKLSKNGNGEMKVSINIDTSLTADDGRNLLNVKPEKKITLRAGDAVSLQKQT